MAFLPIRQKAKINLKDMMLSGECCDLTIKTNISQYKVHKIVLSSIILQNYNGGDELLFSFSDAVLVKIIEFAYTGIFQASNVNDEEIARAATFYKIDRLLSHLLAEKEKLERKIDIKSIYAVGGWADRPTGITECFDIKRNSWSFCSSYHWNSRFPYQAVLYNSLQSISNSIYMIGGCSETIGEPQVFLDTCWKFDFDRKCWQERSFMSYKRCYLATAVLDDKIYALGGHQGKGTARLKSAEVYNPSTNQWDDIADMRCARSDFAAVAYKGTIIAIGGFNGDEQLSSIEQYDPQSDTWTMIGNLVTPRSGVSAEVVDDKLFVFGGYDGIERLDSVECFTLGLNNKFFWHNVPSMTIHRSNFATSVIREGTAIMVIGGFKMTQENDGVVCSDVEILNLKENKWELSIPLQTARSALACCYVKIEN